MSERPPKLTFENARISEKVSLGNIIYYIVGVGPVETAPALSFDRKPSATELEVSLTTNEKGDIHSAARKVRVNKNGSIKEFMPAWVTVRRKTKKS